METHQLIPEKADKVGVYRSTLNLNLKTKYKYWKKPNVVVF